MKVIISKKTKKQVNKQNELHIFSTAIDFFIFIVYIFYVPIVNNSVLFTTYFYIFLLVRAPTLTCIANSIACHKLFGTNVKHRRRKHCHLQK